MKGKTAKTGGVTASAHRYGRFPPSQKQIFCGKTMVYRRTMRKVIDKGAFCASFSVFLDCGNKLSIIKIPRIPPMIVFNAKPRGKISPSSKADRPISPGWKHQRFSGIIHGGKIASNVSGFQKSGHGVAGGEGIPNIHFPNRYDLSRLRIKTNGGQWGIKKSLLNSGRGISSFFFKTVTSEPDIPSMR